MKKSDTQRMKTVKPHETAEDIAERRKNRHDKKGERKKIALCAVGIFLGCILLFGVSFILSVNFLINPTPIVFGADKTDEELEKENQELKEEIADLESQVERLEASVDKYKASASSSYTPPATTVTPSSSEQSSGSEKSEAETSKEDKKENSETKTDIATDKTTEKDKASDEAGSGSKPSLNPETVITPENPEETSPEDLDEDITVIELP